MPFAGTIRVPSDKSISHRAVLFAGLAQGVSHLSRLPAPVRDITSRSARVNFVANRMALWQSRASLRRVNLHRLW
ncbi:MAG: hypothetical protein ACLU0T_06375 [Bacteroidales bacterium]